MNRLIWKQLNYFLASISYVLSLGLVLVALTILVQGQTLLAIFATVFALYFLQQGVYILIASEIVERRRSREPIGFPDRRRAA